MAKIKQEKVERPEGLPEGIDSSMFDNPVAQEHYEHLVAQLKEAGRYTILDDGLLKVMGWAFSVVENPKEKERDRRESARLYGKFAQWFWMSYHARCALRIKTDKSEEESFNEEDLEEFLKG